MELYLGSLLRVTSAGLMVCILVLGGLLSGCGSGNGSGSSSPVSNLRSSAPVVSSAYSHESSSAAVSSSSATSFSSTSSFSSVSSFSGGVSSSSASLITLSGKISYDFVPHFAQRNGLDYARTQAFPGRGLVVELLNANNQVLSTTRSDEQGNYSFTIARNELVRVRVKAQILNTPEDNHLNNTHRPQWDFKVTDNTNNHRIYSMVGSLLAATENTAIRDLHAASGWTGEAYTQPRVAAPFAIIDAIFSGVERLIAVDNNLQFPPLELRWSARNNTASGDFTLGEIATSFYRQDLSAIYILGSEDEDTDEYDRHVILHEWGHYLEAMFSRSDNIGGDHGGDDYLDMRVAMSEGLANAFSAMLLDDPIYRDSSGLEQGNGFQITINRINNSVRGWYSENSIQSVLYNFYVSSANKTARSLAEIFAVITADDYINSDVFVSIYLFAEKLRALFPELALDFNQLLSGQNITITDRFGTNENNSGGRAAHLPIYKSLLFDNTALALCSSNRLGAYNKLGVSQFVVLTVASSGLYQITLEKSGWESGGDSGVSNPDMYLYQNGVLLDWAENATADEETLTHALNEGIYLLEVLDARTADGAYVDELNTCFDMRAVQLH